MKRFRFLTGTNILIFIVTFGTFLQFGKVIPTESYAVSSELFFSGNYHVILTNNLLHSGPSHLFFNCLSIYVFGNVVERKIGVLRTYLIFLAGSLVSGLFWVLLMSGAAIGASDGVFALMAAAVLLAPRKRVTSTFPILDRITSHMIIANFTTVLGIASLLQILSIVSYGTGLQIFSILTKVLGFFNIYTSILNNLVNIGSDSSIARVSHVVGFLAGSFTAYFIKKKKAVSNLKLSTLYMLFLLFGLIAPVGNYRLLGLLGMIGLTLYITPDVRKERPIGQ